MKVDPRRYLWLRSSDFSEAGCVTVVAAADRPLVEVAFGCGEPLEQMSSNDDAVGVDLLDTALLAPVEGGLLVIEDNGFQGGRPEVLRPASRASGTGKAASISWNVNDEIYLTCARRGKVVCSFELGDDPSDIDGLPAKLRDLVRRSASSDEDLVALGAAMVETFTGVAFDRTALPAGQRYALTPPPSDLTSATAEHSPLSYSDSELHHAIVGLPAVSQRKLAEWATLAAVREAGKHSDLTVASMTSQFGAEQPPRLTSAASALASRWERVAGQLENRGMFDEAASGRLETSYAYQTRWAGEALRYSSHPDAMTAALHCVQAALFVYQLSRTERAVAFRTDHTGRWHTDVEGPIGRDPQFRAVLARTLRSDPTTWPALLNELPPPLTPSERAKALERDQEREERGDFDTWQYGG